MPCVNHSCVETGLTYCRRCGRSFCPQCIVEIAGGHYCAECKNDALRDIQSGGSMLRTSAGARIPLASIGSRFLALLLDGIITALAMWIVMLVFVLVFFLVADTGRLNDMSPGVLIGLWMFAMAAMVGGGISYEALMLAWRGQTLGKMALGIKVVTPEGNDISKGQAWGRAAVKVGLGFLGLPGLLINYIPGVSSPERTCMHDRAAKTRVIRVGR